MDSREREEREYPRAVLHVDGDGFFASCEVIRRPELKGKPVVVGAERGIVTALTYEAKALGIVRGMPIARIHKEFPEVAIFAGDYTWYAEVSRRMNAIIARATPEVEPYSIDESFADLTGYQIPQKTTYEKMARRVKEELQQEIGMTFSVGLAPTKTLAKVASKHRKPNGLIFIPLSQTRAFLEGTSIEKVWGIGKRTAKKLENMGISNAWRFAERGEVWVRERFSKPYQEIWRELRGEVVHPVRRGLRGGQKSFMHTRTIRPTTDRSILFGELVRHLEAVMRCAREDRVAPKRIGMFLKTQTFRYQHAELTLLSPTNIPGETLPSLRERFDRLFEEGILYRATGVVIHDFVQEQDAPADLFDTTRIHERFARVYEKVDALNERYGTGAVRLASSGERSRRAVLGFPNSEPAKERNARKFTKGMPFTTR